LGELEWYPAVIREIKLWVELLIDINPGSITIIKKE
jgi:hypothetical protein